MLIFKNGGPEYEAGPPKEGTKL